jgi:ribosomal protein S18 acetylase RimI-like enzyme
MGEVTVRIATADDAPAIAQVHVQTWRETYTGKLADDVIEGRPIPERAAALARLLAGESALGPQTLWVAEREGAIVGFAWAGACRDADRGDTTELYSINVLRAHLGSGAGQQLLDAAIGDEPASLWVLEDNPRARAFYERNGFVADGAEKDDERLGGAHEIRMVRGIRRPLDRPEYR